MNLNTQSRLILAMLAHDLRTPLQGIEGYSDLLLEGNAQPERIAICARAILTCSRHALSMIEDITDAAAVERGMLLLRKEPVNVRDLATEAVLGLEPRLRVRGVLFGLDAPSEPLYVAADRGRLLRVMNNLLVNAIRHTPGSGGKIGVVIRASRTEVVIEVADNGCGIAPEHLESIFEQFVQLDEGRRGSLGLGLYIARRVMEEHGGWLRAYSRGLGQGASFIFCLGRIDPQHGHWNGGALLEERVMVTSRGGVGRANGARVSDPPDGSLARAVWRVVERVVEFCAVGRRSGCPSRGASA